MPGFLFRRRSRAVVAPTDLMTPPSPESPQSPQSPSFAIFSPRASLYEGSPPTSFSSSTDPSPTIAQSQPSSPKINRSVRQCWLEPGAPLDCRRRGSYNEAGARRRALKETIVRVHEESDVSGKIH
eukprot:TRINITY_DN68606_c0_g1_i1.p1 TRINITY_DN68606_c0_g1~~TRINITY_DN68606_c0_g1_i1.p1  ORF type:complete len:138 (+),score=3.85 TRINITY_DN68606_c0_g1_i1:37-414(+)